MKPSKVLITILKGDLAIRNKVADACGVKVSTVQKWIRESDNSLLDLRVLRTVAEGTGIPEENLVEVQISEKVA
jgi:transcriptional regulator with XRE-family HTH domain